MLRGDGDAEETSELIVKLKETILTNQFLFLNPDQAKVWCGPEKQYIIGPAGSGKTILLQYKALESTSIYQEKCIVLVGAEPLKVHYEDFFRKQPDVMREKYHIFYMHDLNDCEQFVTLMDALVERLNIFMDEVSISSCPKTT